MRRLTTPTHRFTLPIAVSACKAVRITYAQGKRKVLTKTLDDAEIDKNTVIVRLSQEDTKAFAAQYDVEIQVRVLTHGGDSLGSGIIRVSVEDVLDDEVLT